MNLYKFAQATEASGIRFYQKMATDSKEDGVKRIFSMLAADEKKLLEKIQLMQQRYPEIADVKCGRLRKDANVFDELRKNSSPSRISSDLEAYHLAQQAEKKIVRQYQKAAAAESKPVIKQFLLWLAALEQHELEEIEQLFDFVNAPTSYLEWGEFSNLDEFHNFGRYVDLRQGDLETSEEPKKKG